MPSRRSHRARSKSKPANVARAVARITKTELPKGEDLLGSEEALRELTKAKARR